MQRKGSKTLREERKQSGNSRGGYVQAVCRGQVRVYLNSVGIDGRARRRSISPSGVTVDEGGLAVAWQGSVSSVASESYRPNGLCRHLRSFKGDLGTIDLSVP